MPDPQFWLVPDMDNVMILISVTLCLLLGIYAYLRKVLNAGASIIASLMGLILIIYADFFWFLLLLFFLISSYFATMWQYERKKGRGMSEGMRGERGVRNVLSNGTIPVLIALMNQPLDSIRPGLSGFLFVTAIAAAGADTFASEIGILADNPRMIIHPSHHVSPGVDGGVSMLGNIAAFFGALMISIVGVVLVSNLMLQWGPHEMNFWILPIITASVLGWIGCQTDSILGATLQQRGILSNNTVNLAAILFTVILAVPVYLVI
ncbi:MAG: hypothetical protein DRN57_08650 [Thermoplasmata archaeon]|nr:MAG: hypothetical protein DRN57_08650 [Thermoplasmata archaeon]